ncbi:fatty acid desaturase [Sphingorhabdus lutea]|uniref:Fatty acid desaturase n=1 Tax=Sphingorhabdus lutea TaxID=1913578 RepID=A0A1L3JAK8_9SPHN|nr:fatty acid desaturase family protein [Sphingorhabdus lutea]APG62162.1 fatty acid desaturase [Sphingorhabdus lutea]
MPAVKAANPKQIFAPNDWAGITSVSNIYGIWLIAHAWLVIFGAAILAAYWGNILGYILAIIIIGGRQLGLAILMHDAAHGHLHPKRKWNNFMGEWLSGAAVGTDLQAYRAYHLTHHRFTQQAEDPDLPLSAPFPVTRNSLLRKFARDISGIVFIRQRTAQFIMALRSLNPEKREQNIFIGRAFIRFLMVQAILLTLSLIIYGWTPFLLWFIALATSFQMFLRIRNIAEHACTSTGGDDPFTHARTTYANLLERATIAPYWVNYHSEHHLFMGVPCYHLSHAHKLLGDGGYHPRMTISPNYIAVLRQVIAPKSI